MYERKILIIDDDEDINNYLKVILKKNDFTVESSTNMKEFFEKVLSFKPHLCLVDLNIGEFNGVGFKILEMLRKKIGNEIIILIMSRRNSNSDINHALESGANDYIQKPLDELILINKLNLFLERNSDDSDLPFLAIASGEQEAKFQIPLTLYSLNEEYIKILSKNYIAKNTYIKIEDGAFGAHKFMIKDVEFNREENAFILKLELDDVNHKDLLPVIRKIIIETPKD